MKISKIPLLKLINTKFKKDLLFSYFSQFIIIGSGFLQLFLINKFFGVTIYGQLMIIVSSAGIFSSLLSPRSSESMTRFITREELNGNYNNAKLIISLGLIVDLLLGLLLVLFIYFTSEFIAQIFLKNRGFANVVYLYSFVTLFGFLRGTLTGFFQSKEKFILINIIGFVESVVSIILLSGVIFLVKSFSLKALIYTNIGSSFIVYLILLIAFINNYLKQFSKSKLKYSSKIVREYIAYNLKTFLSSSLKAGNKNVDNLILGYFLDAKIVGVYQSLKKIMSPLLIMVQPLSLLIYPRMIKYFEQNQKKNLQKIILKTSKIILIIGIGYVILSSLTLRYIFPLMSVNYYSKYLFYFMLLGLISLFSILQWWVRIFSNTINPNFSIRTNFFATLFQILVTIQLVRYFHFIGLLISLLLLNILIFYYYILKLKKYVKSSVQ